MKVEIARLSGYCFGVKRALELTEAALEKYKNKNVKVYSIGQIIHNRGVIDTLNKKGLIIVENEDQIEPGSVFIVRSHGMSPEFINRIDESIMFKPLDALNKTARGCSIFSILLIWNSF